ncbi:sigma-70 family RNA polymerase sigma factor [Leptolyngbya cf. ectocarpi LEGE 11479]|uniref:Sigma-70 family RNA polymerase sigma factor n=1 Tax=Leptolyngbya cf. ectocarpi LEGE 11479 TaxID=1828722 RepID=A0A928ZWD2_LEPEC|nr:sigma-70 family RNA polymerase sigma factor [Leptolyngbya ectocarpi]MBE9068610.1 sigma-70 family RNA polymerase sigma factor [Leptolyngbya cf. ectocarpi LEGE 11479]
MDEWPKIQERLAQLDDFISEVMSSRDNSRPHNLLLLIDRWLKQFHLSSRIDCSEILTETYFQARSEIRDKGVHIEKLPAWFKTVSYRMIRDLSKKAKNRNRATQRLSRHNEHFTENVIHLNEFDHTSIEALLEASAKLKEEELQILKLRIVQGLSWKEVKHRWIAETGKDISEAALRKKGERALKHLRGEFTAKHPKISLQIKGVV